MLLPPLLVALFTIAVVSSPRVLAAASLTASLAVVALPYLHGDPINVLRYVGLHLASIGLAVSLGRYPRARWPGYFGASGSGLAIVISLNMFDIVVSDSKNRYS